MLGVFVGADLQVGPCSRDGRSAFDATLNLRREEISSASLARALTHFPLVTAQVTALIHWQALRLWLKRTPLNTHPKKLGPPPADPLSKHLRGM